MDGQSVTSKMVGAPSEVASLILGSKQRNGAESVVNIIKELIYSTGQSLYNVYRLATPTNSLNLIAFTKMMKTLSNGVLRDEDIKLAFD